MPTILKDRMKEIEITAPQPVYLRPWLQDLVDTINKEPGQKARIVERIIVKPRHRKELRLTVFRTIPDDYYCQDRKKVF